MDQAKKVLERISQVKTYLYQLIYRDYLAQSPHTRSPTLEAIQMVKAFIEQTSGEYTQIELWQQLPKKVLWQAYLVILDYLESMNKIASDRKGTLAYIWNPQLAKGMRDRKEIPV